MAKFLAVVLGAAIGVGIVWFFVVRPAPPAAPAAATSPAASTSTPKGTPPKTPAVTPLAASELAAAIEALTSDDDVVRGSAIEQWGELVSTPDGDRPRMALYPKLVDGFRAKIDAMPEDRLIAYVDAWGPLPWWVNNFPAAHGRYTAWRATAIDNVWLPYAYDQLDRFDPMADREAIRGILEVLLGSSVGKVRFRSLESAAHYLGDGCRPYAMALLKDPENSVARLAWILASKTGGVEIVDFDWHTGPRFVGEAVLYTIAGDDPDEARSICDFIETDPVIANWYIGVTQLTRLRAGGAPDHEVIVNINPGEGPARVFEEAIRADELLSGNYPQYVQE